MGRAAVNAVHIAIKDIRILLSDRSGLLTTFLLPMIFIVVLTGAMQGWMGPNADSALPCPSSIGMAARRLEYARRSATQVGCGWKS